MNPVAVGVHVFAGGFTVGVEPHFTVAAQLEACRVGQRTWQRNRPHIPTTYDTTRQWTAVRAGLRDLRPSLIYGNPPCRAFSNSSVRHDGTNTVAHAHRLEDAWWARDLVALGAEVGAPIVVAESVRGALKGNVHAQIWEEFKTTYPAQTWLLVNAVQHGIPQWRPRAFWVLSRTIADWRRPVIETPPLLACLDQLTPDTPNTEDLSHHVDSFGSYRPAIQALIPRLLPGQRMGKLTADQAADYPAFAAHIEERVIAMHLPIRLRVDRPSPVVYGGVAKLVHPTQGRLLTVHELSRLCGYPEDWTWVGGISRQLDELGKGVCPPVAAWVASECAAQLRGERADRGPGAVTIDVSRATADWAAEWRQLDLVEG